MNESTPRNFVLQLGALFSLYVSVAFVLVLLFGLVNNLIPDPADSVYSLESTGSSMRLAIAMLVVFFPTFLVLQRIVNSTRRKNGQAAYLHITRWLLYLSLLAAGITILIDVVVLIMAFLEGELTERFLLKIAAVFVVVGLAFLYYLKDVRGYWVEREKQSKQYAILVSLVVLAAVVAGFITIPSPQEVRQAKLDDEKIGHLQDMQWRIEDYYRTNDALPSDLETLYGAFTIPTPPDATAAYRYVPGEETEYQLCAEFVTASKSETSTRLRPVFEMNHNWEHLAGEWCFEREIDDRYRL